MKKGDIIINRELSQTEECHIRIGQPGDGALKKFTKIADGISLSPEEENKVQEKI